MGTFVLSVVGNSLVAWIQQLLPPELARRRRLLVASMYILSVLGVVGLGFIYLPGLTQELTEIVHKIQVSSSLKRCQGRKQRHGKQDFIHFFWGSWDLREVKTRTE